MKKLTTIAVALVLSMSAWGAASAGSLATSTLQLQNLRFEAGGSLLDFNTDFSIITFAQNADVSATLNGTTISTGVPAGVGIDIPIHCLGNCADPRIGENFYSVFSTFAGDPTVSGSFASGDQRETGAPILNVPDGLGIGGVLATPASIEAGATVSLIGGAGSSSANNGLTSQFAFIPNFSSAIDIIFDATAYMEAWVNPGASFLSTAQASNNVVFTLEQAGVGIISEWAPNGVGTIVGGGSVVSDPFTLNTTVSRQGPNIFGTAGIPAGYTLGAASVGTFHALTPVLTAGNGYILTARMTTLADATVPEPGMLALLGSGLIGMAAARRRRNSKSA